MRPKQSILLVIPPSPFLLDERVFLSLGILKVAASLEASGHPTKVLDLSGIENFEEVTTLAIRQEPIDAIGITSTTPQLPAAIRISSAIRSERPGLRLILGGPHATLVASAVKLERKRGLSGRAHRAFTELLKSFDVIVSGDGEHAVHEALRTGGSFVDADDPRGTLFLTNRSYEESPMPARHLVDMKSYKYSIDGFPATSLIAQLGCPFGCGFCGGRNSSMLRKIRTRSIESIVSEIEHLYITYGHTGYMLYDDELNVNKSLVSLMRAIADLQSRLGVEFRLRGFIKSELFDEEQAQAMYSAGFRWLLCGFEAADPRILENINKRAALEDNDRVIEISHRHGLKVKALMSVGHPGETEDTILAVERWLVSRAPDEFDCTVITTYPGTPYYDEAVPSADYPNVWTYTAPNGDRLHSVDVDYTITADYYKGDPKGGYRAYVFTDHLSSDEIVRLRNEVERHVRRTLGIPFNPGAPGVRYEHSMGQGALPEFILKETSCK